MSVIKVIWEGSKCWVCDSDNTTHVDVLNMFWCEECFERYIK